jgi:hypothetical protein
MPPVAGPDATPTHTGGDFGRRESAGSVSRFRRRPRSLSAGLRHTSASLSLETTSTLAIRPLSFTLWKGRWWPRGSS